MSVIIDERKYFTRGVAVSIPYDINQLNLSRARIQVKFDTKIVGGVGSKFTIRHSDSTYKGLDGYSSPIMESSIEGTSHVFTVDLTDEIIQNSKFLTVTTNGSMGTEKVELEITNIEISTFGVKTSTSTQMIRIAGRDDNGKARAIKVNEEGELKTDSGGVIVISSEQSKPNISKSGKVLFEYDTGNIFFYDGTEWREFV